MYSDIKLTSEDKKKIVSELLPIYKKVKKKTHIEEDDGNIDCVIKETIEEEQGFFVSYDTIWEFDINEERKQYV